MSPVALRTQHSVVLHGPKDLRYEQRTSWPPQEGHVQIAVAGTGLCGSDLHYYLHGRNGDFCLQAPLVLGHEAAGVVTAVGPGVRGLVVGQRVAIEAGVMCNSCDYCSRGRYNLCKNMRFASSAKTFPHLDGTLQERMNHPAHVVHPLPDNVTFDQAALAEPLSVLIHAFRRAGLHPSSATPTSTKASTPSLSNLAPTFAQSNPPPHPSVLVFGVGAIGLLACALAKSYGASRVCAVDINEARLSFARDQGFADDVFCLPPPTPADKERDAKDKDPMRRVRDNVNAALSTFDLPDGFDIVFECTGVETCIQMSVFAATTGGRAVLVGMGTRNAVLPLSAAATREVDIVGSFRYAHTYPEALRVLAEGSLTGGASASHTNGYTNGHSNGVPKRKTPDITRLITHRVPLAESARAFELLARGRDEQGNMVVKVVIESTPSAQ